MNNNRFVDMNAYLRKGSISRFRVRRNPHADKCGCRKHDSFRPKENYDDDYNSMYNNRDRYTSSFEKGGLTVSQAGLDLIKLFEGFRGNLYNDPVGHCTIGYGILVHRGNCNGSEPEEYKSGITEQRAVELLREKITQYADSVNNNTQVTLNQNQFDSLVSFVYNVGTGAFQQSTLLKELNKGNYQAVPGELRKWVKASGQTLPGLVKRREAEITLFTTPVAATSQSFSRQDMYSRSYSKENNTRPRGIRNNNPGNIVLTKNNEWEGRVPPAQNTDGHFEQFTTYTFGIRALIILLRNYIRGGRNTITKVFEAYAPPAENNTQSYIRFVAGRLGISADDTLSVTKNTLKELSQAIAKMENGEECINDAQFEEGFALLPESIRSSITQSLSYSGRGGGYGYSLSASDRALVVLLENGGIDLGVKELVDKIVGQIPGGSLISQSVIDSFSAAINQKIKKLTDDLLETAELAANRYTAARPEFYNEVVILRNGTASYTDLKNTLIRLTQSDKLIDLFILTHGSNDYISVAGGIDGNKIRQIKKDNGNKPVRLRSVYMMNCIGSTLNQAWLDIGAKVSSGTVRNNYLPEPSMFFFWRNWKSGQSFNDAVTGAYRQTIAAIKGVIQAAGDAVLTGIGGALANYLANIENQDFVKDSAPVIQGDGALTISSDALSFASSLKASPFAVTVMPVHAIA
jgi:GH24 family phage-related lysozyme (muramidase)